MRRYWLMDQHGGEGPTALVETDGRLHIVDVVRFGPSLTELEDQQRVWNQVIGHVAPTMRPLVEASELDEEGVEPHPKLRRFDGTGAAAGRGGTARDGGVGPGGGRALEGPGRRRSRGDR